jgi:hypothetical protein
MARSKSKKKIKTHRAKQRRKRRLDRKRAAAREARS